MAAAIMAWLIVGWLLILGIGFVWIVLLPGANRRPRRMVPARGDVARWCVDRQRGAAAVNFLSATDVRIRPPECEH